MTFTIHADFGEARDLLMRCKLLGDAIEFAKRVFASEHCRSVKVVSRFGETEFEDSKEVEVAK